MSQILRPVSDYDVGDYEPEPSDTTLWNTIDEASPNDSDYAWLNACSGVYEYFEVDVTTVDPPGSGTGTLRWRFARIDGTKNITFICQLLEGGVYLCDLDSLLVSDDNWHQRGVVVSQEELGLVTDWSNVQLRLGGAAAAGGGKSPDPAISWAEFEVPDAGVLYVPKIMKII